jgi:hypothetical protein
VGCIVEIIDSSNSNFSSHWDSICEKAEINPIFGSTFFSFYTEYLGFHFKSDHRLLVLDNNKPILALSMTKTNSDKLEFNFFEKPLTLFSHLSSSQVDLEVALSLLFREFDQLIPNNFFNNSTLEYRYSEYFDDKGVTSFGKKCIELSSVVLPVFEQYVPLNGELTSIESCFSKSVKTAIKDSIKRDLRVNIYNSDSNQSDSLIAFGELRRLHFESAQRSTRSNSTWDIQYNLILQDESFLITISDASEVLGAALFYNNKATAYYAVSARKSEIKFSVSHALIYEGIKYSKKIGLKRLYMGTQFSNKIGDSNKKIDSIENFKSFFGGVYIYGFLAKR